MASISDISLVTQVTVFHNRRAFDRLVVKYQSPIRRFFLHMTHGDEATSDDLAQDTFIKAYTHLAQFRATSQFSTWLYRIAYNVFYDYTRRQASNPQNSSSALSLSEPSASAGTHSAPASLPSAGGATAEPLLSYDLQQAFAILSDNERLCITLQLVEGQPIDEIATITGMPSGTVKSHLSRGKDKLATFLRQNGYDNKSSKR